MLNKLPPYCFYQKEKTLRSKRPESFTIIGHPKLNESSWITKISPNETRENKLKEVLLMVQLLDGLPDHCYYNPELDKFEIIGHPKIVGVNWTNTLNSNDTYENKLDELEYVLKILNDLPAHCYYDPELHNFKIIKHPKFKNTTVIDIKGYRMIDRVNTLHNVLKNHELF